jgi:copper chaperone NosL
MRRAVYAIAVVVSAACGGRGVPPPVALMQDSCASCRMVIASAATAAAVTTSGGEPLYFDDLGCLKTYLASAPADSAQSVYVADHRTGAWVAAREAVFTRVQSATAMGSGLVAHADEASKAADTVVRDGTPVGLADALGANLGGERR